MTRECYHQPGRSRRRWRMFDLVILALATFVIFPITAPYVGRAEGNIAPVLRRFVIETAHPISNSNYTGAYGSLIYGHMTVLRPECSFMEVRWFLEDQEVYAPVDVTYLDGTVIRPEGVSQFGPWRLSISPDSLAQTRAVVIHRCPYRPWLTETALFPTVED